MKLTNKINSLKKYFVMGAAVLALATFAPRPALADDIYKGMRGPTNWQIDMRGFYLKNEKGLEALTNMFILKYWDGKERGKECFVIVPYKFIKRPDGSSSGTGDITIGCGPRFSINNLHLFPYFALTLPTGELGNERYDEKIGLLATLDKKLEIDLALQYTFTGKNKEGINPPNQLYMGLVGGGKITDKLRGVFGFKHLRKQNGDYSLGLRFVSRYTLSKYWLIELNVDKVLAEKNMPKGYTLEFQLRHNF